MNISSNSLYGLTAYSYGSSSSSASSLSSQFAEALLTSMDSDSSGSIDSAEFSSAALSLSSSNTESDAAATFSALDTNEDGVVSIDELTSSIESVIEQQGTMASGNTPPPPPSSSSDSTEDVGYTQEELSAMATSTSSTDSALSSLFETLSSNFDKADADGDGKITSQEAMAYQESTKANSVEVSQEKDNSLMKNLLAQIISSYTTQSSAQTSTLTLSA